jgi:hypothetical protein
MECPDQLPALPSALPLVREAFKRDTYYAALTIVSAYPVEQLLCDTHRNLLYALKCTEIDVLDAAKLQWKTPIGLPGFLSREEYSGP